MKLSNSVFTLAFTGPVFSALLPYPNSYPGHALKVDNRTLDEIYASVHTTCLALWKFNDTIAPEASQGDPTIAAWKARFPDVALNLTVDVSKYHDSRVNRQFQRNGDDGADIAVLQTLQDYGRWKHEGRLYPYKPAGWDNIYSAIKDPEVEAFATSPFYHIILTDIRLDQFGNLIFNTNLLNETEKSKLALTIPNDDDAITYLFSVIIEKYGWECETNTTRTLSFTTNLNGAANLASKTPDDARLLWPQTGAVFATLSRPESSKLFMSWLISDECQQQFVDGGYYLARKDLNSSLGDIWNDDFTPLTQFATFMENRDVVEWWRLQFETSLGTAQGPSPVLSEYGRRTAL
ncbi:periplasmic binding protein-like II [Aureobasidium pullulans]|nr:periplasmic binding protein-like II [Aureobasidium pullulans]